MSSGGAIWNLGACRCTIECELRRLRCRDCGVHLEPVPWARPGAGYTRDFEDVVAWLAQQMAKTPIARLLHVAWDSVGRIVKRVVADELGDRGGAALKALVTEAVNEHLRPLRQRRRELAADPTIVRNVLDEGNARANCIANRTLQQVREVMDMTG